VKECPNCAKFIAPDAWLCDCGYELPRVQTSTIHPTVARPTRLRAAFIAQLVFGIILFQFSSSQVRQGRFDFVALFCIILPPTLIFCAVGGLRRARWSLLPSVVTHRLIALAAACVGLPELFYMVRGIDRGWLGPTIIVTTAPIFLISFVLARTIYRNRGSAVTATAADHHGFSAVRQRPRPLCLSSSWVSIAFWLAIASLVVFARFIAPPADIEQWLHQ
jgi:hypothetical protein